jgi:acetylornithine deacetylase/succinyl-diaminopimelate desuccinylase-like protein
MTVSYQEIAELLRRIVTIPAPSGEEAGRARFICSYLNQFGAQASVDAVCNVLLPMPAKDGHGGFSVLAAHIDTGFPDGDITVRQDGDLLSAPGIGDDAANVAILLKVIETIFEKKLRPKRNILFAFDACEEGLGNLKGVREIMRAYAGRVKEFVSFDLTSERIYVKSVGSKRYRIGITTPGGHSFGAFGNVNAIAQAAKIIGELYSTDVKKYDADGTATTTYNVGTIRGGTSVNAIAEACDFTAEVRSDCAASLAAADADLRALFEKYAAKDVAVDYELVGDRPSMGAVDPGAMRELTERAFKSVAKYAKKPPVFASGSTDCNIPLLEGVPAVAFGGYTGGCAHSVREWIDAKSLETGYNILYDFIMAYFE